MTLVTWEYHKVHKKLFWHPPPGTKDYYDFLPFTYTSYCFNCTTKFLPRDPALAAKLFTADEITSDTTIVWFFRRMIFRCTLWLGIKHEKNPDFNTDVPLGYQWSRVQEDRTRVFEYTRQIMCLYCQDPSFFYLRGSKSNIFCHIESAHPRELPRFVEHIMTELNLKSTPRPHSAGTARCPSPQSLSYSYPKLRYREDGKSNRVMVSARAGHAEHSGCLSSFDNQHLFHWYSRSIDDLSKYKHGNVRYELNPEFDPDCPEGFQISRSLIEENGESAWGTREYMCLHCQKPRFFSAYGTRGLLAHVAAEHHPYDIPGRELIERSRNTSTVLEDQEKLKEGK